MSRKVSKAIFQEKIENPDFQFFKSFEKSRREISIDIELISFNLLMHALTRK